MNLPGIVNGIGPGNRLMGHDHNRPFEFAESFFQPRHLVLSNELGITSLVLGRTLLVRVEHDEMKAFQFMMIIGRFHSPRLKALFFAQTAVSIVVPDDVKSGLMSLVETIDNHLIRFIGEGKVSHLQESIRLALRHFAKKSIESFLAIGNEIHMQVCNYAHADRFGESFERRGSHGGNRKTRSTKSEGFGKMPTSDFH